MHLKGHEQWSPGGVKKLSLLSMTLSLFSLSASIQTKSLWCHLLSALTTTQQEQLTVSEFVLDMKKMLKGLMLEIPKMQTDLFHNYKKSVCSQPKVLQYILANPFCCRGLKIPLNLFSVAMRKKNN